MKPVFAEKNRIKIPVIMLKRHAGGSFKTVFVKNAQKEIYSGASKLGMTLITFLEIFFS